MEFLENVKSQKIYNVHLKCPVFGTPALRVLDFTSSKGVQVMSEILFFSGSVSLKGSTRHCGVPPIIVIKAVKITLVLSSHSTATKQKHYLCVCVWCALITCFIICAHLPNVYLY